MLAGVMLAATAHAQTIIGGSRKPAVSIDTGVLDRLGAAPTLPQFFLGARNPQRVARPVAMAERTIAPRRYDRPRSVAARRGMPASRNRSAQAPARRVMASSLNQIIHLNRPDSRFASAAPPPAPVSHDQAAINEPTTPAVTALATPVPMPAPMPKPPQSSDIPPPVLSPQPAREVVPMAPPVAPPSPAAAKPPSVALATAASPPAAQPSPVVVASTPPGAAPATVAAPAPPVQMAAATTVGAGLSAVKFGPGATELPPGPQPALDAVAARLLGNDNLRVQVIAHATGGADDSMEARRVSLARAVAVRAYLIDKGVRSLRIDVRALGNRADDGPAADQVDLMVVTQ